MAKIYFENPDKCELIKARPETVSFLLNYSKSLDIVKVDGLSFENNLN